MATFTIRGTRGSMPSSRRDCLQYGGSTSCYTVETRQGILILDAGTGLSNLADELAARNDSRPMTLLFTHFHMDHVVGLPCFEPLHNPQTRLSVMADPTTNRHWQDALHQFMRPPFWPVGLGEAAAQVSYDDLPSERAAVDLYGIRVTWTSVPHPQHCLAYRLELPEFSLVLCTDAEYEPDRVAPSFVAFARGADVLLFDAHYLPREYPGRRGWGHSTWRAAVAAARAAEVGRLVFIHHAPHRPDREIDRLVCEARADFPWTVAAAENMVVHPAAAPRRTAAAAPQGEPV